MAVPYDPKLTHCDNLETTRAVRHAKSWEPGNLVPGHFWSKIWTFFKNLSFKEINLNLCCGFVKKQVQMNAIFTTFFTLSP